MLRNSVSVAPHVRILLRRYGPTGILTFMRVLAVGSPKGGVGKTTTAVTIAALASREMGLRTLLVDSDANRSALDWTARADSDAMPFETVDGQDLSLLSQLRSAAGYDLAIVDLPGAREGAFRTILAGDGGPVADLLLVPTEHEVMSVAPIERVIRHEVAPLGLPCLVAITRIDPQALNRAAEYRAQLHEHYDLTVAETPIRSYAVYRDARERLHTVFTIGGSHSYARRAEADYRALAHEVFTALNLHTATDKEDS